MAGVPDMSEPVSKSSREKLDWVSLASTMCARRASRAGKEWAHQIIVE